MPLQPLDDYLLKLPDPTEQLRKNIELSQQQAIARQQQAIGNAQILEHQAKVQQMQLSQARQQAYQADLANMSSNPSAHEIVMLMSKYPEMKDHLQQVHNSLSEEEKAATAETARQIFMAGRSQQFDVAAKVAREAATANRNSGRPEKAKTLDLLADQIEKGDIKAAQIAIGGYSATADGFDKFIANDTAIQKQASELKEAAGKAEQEYQKGVHQEEREHSALSAEKAARVASYAAAGASGAAKKKSEFELFKGELMLDPDLEEAEAKARKEGFLAQKAGIDYETAKKTQTPTAEAELALKTEAVNTAKLANYISQKYGIPLKRVETDLAEHRLSLAKKYDEPKVAAEIREASAKATIGEANASTAFDEARTRLGIQEQIRKKEEIENRFRPDRLGTEIAQTEVNIKETGAKVSKMLAEAGTVKREPSEIAALSKSATEARDALIDAKRINELSKVFKGKNWWGGPATWAHRAFEFAGGTTNWGVLRDKYIQERNKLALLNLPRGPASNADLLFAKEAFADPNASSSRIAAALAAMARVREQDAKLKRIENLWVFQNRHEGPAEREMTIEGVRVPKNTPLIDFYDMLIPGAKVALEQKSVDAERTAKIDRWLKKAK